MGAFPEVQRFVVSTEGPGSSEDSLRFVERVREAVAVIGVPTSDTCKEVVDGIVRRTVPRVTVVDARGPWLFAREEMVTALKRAIGQEHRITSLVTLCRIASLRVRVLAEK